MDECIDVHRSGLLAGAPLRNSTPEHIVCFDLHYRLLVLRLPEIMT